MSRTLGRIPADQIVDASGWALPTLDLDNIESNKLFKLQCGVAEGRLGRRGQNAASEENVAQHNSVTSNPSTSNSKNNAHEQDSQMSPEDVAGVQNSEVDTAQVSNSQQPIPGYEAGFDSGYASGFEQGDAAGLAAGEAKGFAAGEVRGLKESEEKGFAVGEAKGFSQGEASGVAAGELKGLAQGKKLAEQAFEKEVASKKQLLQPLLAAFQSPPDTSQAVQAQLVQLVVSLAGIVLQRDVQTAPGLINQLVAGALAALPDGVKQIQVLVNPADLPWCDSNLSELNPGIKYAADKTIALGGCKVNSKSGVVDATLSTRLNACFKQILLADELSKSNQNNVVEVSESDLQAAAETLTSVSTESDAENDAENNE
ncbi:MAG: hypothetical protein KUG79_07720 [Pseudomonadales bacterium]|nr:hypothetical protein [Pseudomonadales bacterium]